MGKNAISLCVILLAIVYVFCCNNNISEPAENGMNEDVLQKYHVSVVGDYRTFFDFFDSTMPRMSSAVYERREPPEWKTLSCDRTKHEVRYTYSQVVSFVERDFYESADGNISCSFFKDRIVPIDWMYSLETKNRIMFPDSTVDTEEEYRDWTDSLFRRLGDRDFTRVYGYEYEYSCKTYVGKISESGENVLLCTDGFHSPVNGEKIYKYVFEYVRYYDGYATSDRKYVILNFADGSMSVRMHDHSLVNLESQRIDKDGAESSAGVFLTRVIDEYRYKIDSYHIKDQTLYSVKNDEYCVLYNVSANLISLEDEETLTKDFLLLVHDCLQ